MKIPAKLMTLVVSADGGQAARLTMKNDSKIIEKLLSQKDCLIKFNNVPQSLLIEDMEYQDFGVYVVPASRYIEYHRDLLIEDLIDKGDGVYHAPSVRIRGEPLEIHVNLDEKQKVESNG